MKGEKTKKQKRCGGAGYRSLYLSHAKRALYHLSYTPIVGHTSTVLAFLIDGVPWSADSAGVRLFINARLDTYLLSVGDEDGRLDATLARAAAYVAAGASGVFVAGVVDPKIVSALADGIDAPLNVLTGPGAPPIPELAALGVARISLGSSIASAAYGLVQRAAREAFTTGTYEAISDPLGYPTLNNLIAQSVRDR